MLRRSRAHVLAGLAVACATSGCATWVPVHSAREAEGRRVKVEVAGKETVIDDAVTCDDEGFILAAQMSDCRDSPEKTYDARRAKVVAEEDNAKSASVGYIVAAVLAAVFVPAGIIGTAVLGIR